MCAEKGERPGKEEPVSPSMSLTCDHHLLLSGDLRSVRVGWDERAGTAVCSPGSIFETHI